MQYLTFTFHKAGSMALHAYLGWLADAVDLPHHSPNNTDDPGKRSFRIYPEPTQNDPDWWQTTGRHLDGLIGPIRRPIVLPDDLDARGIIAVRDPRDALTSMFYSFTFSHKGIADAERKRWEAMGVDKFALQRLGDMKERLIGYRAMLDARPHWSLVRYEDMVLRFDVWLSQVLDGFGLTPDPAAVAAFAQAKIEEYRTTIAARQKRERIELHVRNVAPGDHLRKLQPETIAAINTALADELAFFGYPPSGV